MITKEKALEIAKNYLAQRQREYESIAPLSEIYFHPNNEVLYGKRKGQFTDAFSVGYEETWGDETRLIFIVINANTGEVLYSASPHGFIEEWED